MSELVTIEKKLIPDVFIENGLQPYLDKITNEVSGLVPDLSTDKGRKEVASLAHKVAKSKTYLDGLGKDYVAELKQLPKTVDAERKRMRDYLDVLRDEIRRPLTEWEDKEKQRIHDIQASINAISSLQDMDYSDSDQIAESIKQAESFVVDDSLAEFEGYGKDVKEKTLALLNAALIVKKQEEKEAEAAAKAEAERIENERIEREEKIRQEAAEKARIEAEQKAKIEQERIEAEKQAAIQAQKDAERREKEAAEKAESEKQQAIENERLRIEAKQKAEAEEEEKRARNRKHKAAINNEVMSDLLSIKNIDETTAKEIVKLIATGNVRHTKITY